MLNGMLKENIRYISAKVEPNKRVAIYCRVSTTHVSQEESLEAQIEGLKHLVENNPNGSYSKFILKKIQGGVPHVWSFRKCYLIATIICLIAS